MYSKIIVKILGIQMLPIKNTQITIQCTMGQMGKINREHVKWSETNNKVQNELNLNLQIIHF